MGGKSNKAMILLGKAKTAVEALEVARQDGAEREDELLQLLVENLAPEDGGNCGHYVANANLSSTAAGGASSSSSSSPTRAAQTGAASTGGAASYAETPGPSGALRSSMRTLTRGSR